MQSAYAYSHASSEEQKWRFSGHHVCDTACPPQHRSHLTELYSVTPLNTSEVQPQILECQVIFQAAHTATKVSTISSFLTHTNIRNWKQK